MSELFETFFLFGKNYCATLAIGFVCAYLGLYCVMRRIVFTGVALAQLAAAGVAGAFFIADRGLGPISRFAGAYGATWGSLGMSLLGVLGLELRSKKQGGPTPDALVGLAYAASSAIAILLVWRSSRGLTELQNILAGEVLLTGEGELFSLWIGLAAVALLHVVLRREFLLVSFDPEFARAQGLNERRFQLLLLGSLAVAVALSLKAGGLLLVFAFLVLPPVAGLSISRGLAQAALFSALTAGAASFLGFLLAISRDWPVGPTVSVCLLGFVIAFRGAKLHPSAQTAARFFVGVTCGLALLFAPISILAGPSAPEPLAQVPAPTTPTPAQTPTPTTTTAGDPHGHGHGPATPEGGIDLVAVSSTLKHGSVEERKQALTQLGEKGGAWALQPLLSAALDEEVTLRETVQEAVAAVCLRDPRGLSSLDSFRNHPVPEMRLAAAQLLQFLEQPQAKTALVDCLADAELPPFHRLGLLETLAALNGGDEMGFDAFAEDPAANAQSLASWRAWASKLEIKTPEELAAQPEVREPLPPPPMGDGHGHGHGVDPALRPGVVRRAPPKVGGSIEDLLRSKDPAVRSATEDELRARGEGALPILIMLISGGSGHDHGQSQRVDPAIPARLLVALRSTTADEVLQDVVRGSDPAAAVAVVKALDTTRHRALLEQVARGPRTVERRTAIARLARLDDRELRPLMEMGAREGVEAATAWLGEHAPARALELLGDDSLTGQVEALCRALVGALEEGQLGTFQEGLSKLLGAAKASQATPALMFFLSERTQLLKELASAPLPLQEQVELGASGLIGTRLEAQRQAGNRLLRVVGRLPGALTLLGVTHPRKYREALEACGARLAADDLPPLLALLATTQAEETLIEGLALLGPFAARAVTASPKPVSSQLDQWLAKLSPERRARARTILCTRLEPKSLALPALLPHVRTFVCDGGFFEDDVLRVDPRRALQALVLANTPLNLEPALRAVHTTLEDPTLGAEIHEAACATWDRLLEEHPRPAAALARELWTQTPAQPVGEAELLRLDLALLLTEDASQLPEPLTLVGESWPKAKNPEVAEALADVAFASAKTETLPELMPFLAKVDDDTWEVGLGAIVGVLPRDTQGVLNCVKALQPLPPARRRAALEAIVEQLRGESLASPELRPLRREYLSRRDLPMRHVVSSLTKGHDAADLPIALAHLPSDAPEEEGHAEAHGDHVHPAAPRHPIEAAWPVLCEAYPEAARALAERTLKAGPADRRLALAHRLDAIPGCAALVFRLWKTLPADARAAAAQSLLHGDDPATTAGLAAHYDALSPELREGLLERIADEADPEHLPLVGRALRSRHPGVRARAQDALTTLEARARSLQAWEKLSQTAAPDPVDELLPLLESEDPRVVLGAVKALGALRVQRALPALVKLLKGAPADLERAVLEAIDRCGGSSPSSARGDGEPPR